MAAPIASISVAAPAELIAPQAAASNVNKGAFKSELNSASNSVNRAQNSRQDTSGDNQQVVKKPIKSSDNKASNESVEASGSQSKSTVKDSGLARAEAEQQHSAQTDDAKFGTQHNSDENVDQVSQGSVEQGQKLPTNGETLPLVKADSSVELPLITPNTNQSTVNPELANSSATTETSQKLTTELLASLVTAQTSSEPAVSVAIKSGQAPEQIQSQAAREASLNAAAQAQALAAGEKIAAQAVTKAVTAEPKVTLNPNVSATVVDPTTNLPKVANNSQQPVNPIVAKALEPAVATNKAQNPAVTITSTGPAENKAKISANIPPVVVNTNKATVSDSVEAQVIKAKNSNDTAEVVKAVSGAIVTPDASSRETALTSQLQQQESPKVATTDRDFSGQLKSDAAMADARASDAKLIEVSAEQKPPVKMAPGNGAVAPESAELATAINKSGEALVTPTNKPEPLQPQASAVNSLIAEAKPIEATAVSREVAAKSPQDQQARNQGNSAEVSQSAEGKKPADISPPIVNAKVSQSSSELSVALNQSLEKLRSGIEASAVGKSTDEGNDAKAASAKTVTNTESLQQLTSLQQSLRTTSPVQMQMPAGTTPTSQNWGRAVADKVFIAASQNLRVANIQLDPPELGALQIRLQITGPDQQMSVSFSSPHAAVRDVLEGQIPRLREMLAEQGINLGESSVSDQGTNNNQGSESSEQQGNGQYAKSSENEASFNPLNTQGTLALVDFYA